MRPRRAGHVGAPPLNRGVIRGGNVMAFAKHSYGWRSSPVNNSEQGVLKFEAVTPRLPVPDVDKALTFYVDQLGFQLGWKWGNPTTHANVCRDSISMDLIALPAGRCGTAIAYIQRRGVDAYFAELKRRNVHASELGDRPYGMRDFEVIDPSGNRIAFGEPTAD
jgi:catechol 2,3-dioxygenase-like lactoylglutathione lyase family enzyme